MSTMVDNYVGQKVEVSWQVMLHNVKFPEISSLSVFCVQRQLRQLYKKWNLYGVFQKWRQDHSLPKK